MNAANLSKSDRLQRLLSVLSDGNPHTTRDLVRRAHIMAVSACVSELRAAGKQISCWRSGDKWWYQLLL